jgi:hypothetical protein
MYQLVATVPALPNNEVMYEEFGSMPEALALFIAASEAKFWAFVR